MDTTFIINGGAGRVISAIPSLELFHKLNPDTNFNVLVSGWESLFFCHPLLHTKTYSFNLPHIFDKVKHTKIVCPEPYFSTNYITQQSSLAEAYNESINGIETNHLLSDPKLYLAQYENAKAFELLTTLRYEHQREKIIVFQPYGSSAQVVGGQIIDNSNRSLSLDTYLEIVEKLSEDHIVIYFGPKSLESEKDHLSVKIEQSNDLRTFCSLIAHSDYFLGVDSAGQHIAKAFNKPGTVIMGATFEKNVSYPEYFNFFRPSNRSPKFVPLRFNDFDREFIDRQNDGILDFTFSDVNNLCNQVSNYFTLVNTIEHSHDYESNEYVIGEDYK